MPLTDISQVTETLTTLISQTLVRDMNVSNLEVSAAPPDDDSAQLPNVISVHLFHVMEDPDSKNLMTPASMTAPTPVQHTQMGLILYYIITARSTANDIGGAGRALIEQRLLGFVARAFHDVPLVDDDTVIPSVPSAPPNPPLLQTTNLRGNGNQIQIILRPVGIDEVVNFWSAEQERIARLSLFYEVRVIMLETPPEAGSAPPVLSLAEFVSVSDQLILICARSLLGFALPVGHALADPASPFRFIDAVPARVALFPPGTVPSSVPPQNNRVTFEGSGFQGDRTLLSIEGAVGEGNAAPTTRRFQIDLADPANAAWSIDADGVRISLGIRTSVASDQNVTFTLYPGIYRARVVVGTQVGEGPTPRFLEQSSADVAFAVVPQIVSVALQGGPETARQFQIALLGDYLRDELEVRLTVAGQALQRGPDPTVAGTFNFTANSGAIDMAVDTSTRVSPISVQLIINGAEAPPAWGTF